MTESLPIDGRSLTLEQFLAVVRSGCSVSLTDVARSAIASSRRAVERAVGNGRPIYGVTTGFGSLSDRTIPVDQARALQLGLIRSHASGVGPALPADVVRGMILLRANSLACGHSGVRVELVERLLELLNRQLVPWVPETGSVGASGDLAPLAHLSLAIIGEGAFVDGSSGRAMPASEALAHEGLSPTALVEKEGVALINGTSLMAAYLALAVTDGRALLRAAEVAAAVSFDALRGSPEALEERLAELKRSPEQREVSRALRTLLGSSQLAGAQKEYRGQDPYTLRCIPQVLGAVELALRGAENVARQELNAVSDNPIVFEGDEFVSGGTSTASRLRTPSTPSRSASNTSRRSPNVGSPA